MHLAVDRSLQARAVLAERLDDAFVSLFAKHGVEIHNGSVHLWVNIDRSDGEELKPFVLDSNEVFGDYLAQNLRETGSAGVPVRRAPFGLTGTRPWALFRHAYTMAQP